MTLADERGQQTDGRATACADEQRFPNLFFGGSGATRPLVQRRRRSRRSPKKTFQSFARDHIGAVKKYITKSGFDRLRAEFRRLLYDERPRVTHEGTVAAAHGDRSEEHADKLGQKKR